MSMGPLSPLQMPAPLIFAALMRGAARSAPQIDARAPQAEARPSVDRARASGRAQRPSLEPSPARIGEMKDFRFDFRF